MTTIILWLVKRLIKQREVRVKLYQLLIGTIERPNQMIGIAEELYEGLASPDNEVPRNWCINVVCLSLKELLAKG